MFPLYPLRSFSPQPSFLEGLTLSPLLLLFAGQSGAHCCLVPTLTFSLELSQDTRDLLAAKSQGHCRSHLTCFHSLERPPLSLHESPFFSSFLFPPWLLLPRGPALGPLLARPSSMLACPKACDLAPPPSQFSPADLTLCPQCMFCAPCSEFRSEPPNAYWLPLSRLEAGLGLSPKLLLPCPSQCSVHSVQAKALRAVLDFRLLYSPHLIYLLVHSNVC